MRVRRLTPRTDQWPTGHGNCGADYSDAFQIVCVAGDKRSAEAWMRSALEGAPPPVRLFVQIGWRLILGFRPSAGPNVLGWRVDEADADWVVLKQQSRLFQAALLLRRETENLTWETAVTYRARGARTLWIVVGLIHRRIVPFVLRRAVAETG